MNVDDAGLRAGTALRDRFDRLPAPALAEPAPRRSRSGRTAVLAGVAAVLVVALLVALVAPWRDQGGPAEPGGTWRRIDYRKAFGRHASPTLITTWRGRLVALGLQAVPEAEPPRTLPAVWASDDGEHWDRVHIEDAPRRFAGFASVAVSEDAVIAGLYPYGRLWRSTDLHTWKQVFEANGRRDLDPVSVQRAPDRFVARTLRRGSDVHVFTSRDGRTWARRYGPPTGEGAVGLSVGAVLDGRQISVGGGATEGSLPGIYLSDDGVKWRQIIADAPMRLGSPLASNQQRSRVLGIQYDDFPENGGRLWSTRDGSRWSEILSFHEQMPVGNPDHLVQVGRWWVLGGNSGVPSTAPQGERRATMWTSPDLQHWYEMPEQLRGPKTGGVGVPLIEHDGRVIGRSGRWLWIWTRPD